MLYILNKLEEIVITKLINNLEVEKIWSDFLFANHLFNNNHKFNPEESFKI